MAPGDDKAAISRIYEASWRSAYRGILPQDYLDSIPAGYWVPYLEQAGRNVLVMEEDGQLIGTASYCASRDPSLPEYGEVVSIYLLPDWQGMGYGRLLLDAAIAELAARLAGYGIRKAAAECGRSATGNPRLPGYLFVGSGGKPSGPAVL